MTWRVAILVCSDSRSQTVQTDPSAQVIRELVEEELYGEIVDLQVVPDEKDMIRSALIEMADYIRPDLIFTTGGIGLQARDVTPDATIQVLDQTLPGVAEVMRAACLEKAPKSMFTRGIAGLRRQVMIINLPGTPKMTYFSLNAIIGELPYALEKLKIRREGAHDATYRTNR